MQFQILRTLLSAVLRTGNAAGGCLPLMHIATSRCSDSDQSSPHTLLQDVPSKLPPMLHCVRAIWVLCKHYSVPERLLELLRQMGGQVIACCRNAIPLRTLLAGDVTAGVIVLQEVLVCSYSYQHLGGLDHVSSCREHDSMPSVCTADAHGKTVDCMFIPSMLRFHAESVIAASRIESFQLHASIQHDTEAQCLICRVWTHVTHGRSCIMRQRRRLPLARSHHGALMIEMSLPRPTPSYSAAGDHCHDANPEPLLEQLREAHIHLHWIHRI